MRCVTQETESPGSVSSHHLFMQISVARQLVAKYSFRFGERSPLSQGWDKRWPRMNIPVDSNTPDSSPSLFLSVVSYPASHSTQNRHANRRGSSSSRTARLPTYKFIRCTRKLPGSRYVRWNYKIRRIRGGTWCSIGSASTQDPLCYPI